MALEHPRLLAASLTAAVLSTACSTPDENRGPESPSPGDSQNQSTTNPAARNATRPQDPNRTPQDIVRDERRDALVAHYLETARGLRSNGNLEGAKSELLKAKDLSPTNEEVRSLLAAVQAELGEAPGRITSFGDEQVRLQQIGEERARTDVTTRLSQAQKDVAAKNFAGAIEQLRVAALTIELKDNMEWGTLPKQVSDARMEAERLYDEQQRQSQAQKDAELAERLRAEYAEAESRRRAQVANLLQEGQLAFEQRNFRRAQELSDRAMQVEPGNVIAFELHNAAVKAGRDKVNDDYYHQRSKALRQMLETDAALKVPQTEVLEMDLAVWSRAKGRAALAGKSAIVEPQDQAVWDKVRTEQVGKLSYTEETGDYLEVIKNLNLVTGVHIITTPGARTVIGGESLKLVIDLPSSISLENFLNHMVGRSTNLAWTVRDGVVVIGNKAEASGAPEPEIHPVQDLVFKRSQFLAPRIRDIPGEDQDETPRAGGEGEDPIEGIAIADLVQNLKDATDPKYWETEGVEIRAEEASGLLSVKASAEMQARVRRVLADMRNFQTPVVTIDSKFLTISRNFLMEFGIDFRGLGGSGNKGSVATLDDITNGLDDNASRGLDNAGTGDPAANPLSGAFFNDGGDGDIRARTENFFTSDLGRVLTPSGGLTAGWTLLDDTQLNMILRAVEKKQDAEVLNSQILSVLNRERGHVAVINQTAYVRDFDVEVAQAAFIADPKVDVIQDGIVLDVQPVIQHDRKYIILTLSPTVAELQRPIPTFTTSLAGSTLPVTLQLPNLTVTQFSTTAKVPDGGTVLLGGLRQVLTKERRAEIPLLARLPLVSFLFKQEGSADENKSLMVMVRAQITDVRED